MSHRFKVVKGKENIFCFNDDGLFVFSSSNVGRLTSFSFDYLHHDKTSYKYVFDILELRIRSQMHSQMSSAFKKKEPCFNPMKESCIIHTSPIRRTHHKTVVK